MLEPQQPKLFDSKTVIAIIIIGLFYVAWQNYLNKKYPNMKSAPAAAAPVDSQQTGKSTAETINKAEPKEAATATDSGSEVKLITKPAQVYSYEDDKVSFQISSNGMSVGRFELKKYTDRKDKLITLTPAEPGLFEMSWGNPKQPLSFDVKVLEKGVFVGTTSIGQLQIERKLTYLPESYSFLQEINLKNPGQVTGQFNLTSQDKILIPESSSWLFPSYEHQDFLTFVGEKKELINTSHASESFEKKIKAINLYSLGSQYFTVGFLDESEILADLTLISDFNSKSITHALTYQIPQLAEFQFKNKMFVGPKSSESLLAAHEKFVELMDYGMLAFISKPMLASMKWFYSLIGNWGFAIVFLTLLVRAVVLPFNLMSYRSMKGMQKIQPLLTDLRAKYKDDAVTLNKEMMAIMKNNNANPLAGCLPILLQIPIFFALYRVIGSSVELYQAPFGLWIHDLSLHDKFYVLPILMGITMYIQQKLTPTTMDPMQAKILTWMPVIFSLFMLNLPAGLTLYMVVSAVFGIVQQKTFMTMMKN